MGIWDMTKEEILSRKVLLTSDVALLFRVKDKTVVRYVTEGKIPHFRTPGGNLRYYEDEVLPLVRPDMRGPAAG